MKKFLAILITIFIAGVIAVLLFYEKPTDILSDLNQYKTEYETNKQNQEKPAETVTKDYVLLTVPFIPQAPTAKWSDPRQQDGCEEASILMAHLWLIGKTMSLQDAEKEIIALSEYQNEKYGGYVDRSITDTGKLFEEYYHHSNYEIKRRVTAEDIKKELAAGNLVIVPTNGQILDNPNYTDPGPITHMLPIIGYDEAKKEFITNDPGTRNGRQFRFGYDRLINSIYDYETGHHEGYEKTDTVMMVVEK